MVACLLRVRDSIPADSRKYKSGRISDKFSLIPLCLIGSYLKFSILPCVKTLGTSEENEKMTTTLVLVLPVYCTPMRTVEVIKKMCPQVKHVFSTRHPLASIQAISQVSKRN